VPGFRSASSNQWARRCSSPSLSLMAANCTTPGAKTDWQRLRVSGETARDRHTPRLRCPRRKGNKSRGGRGVPLTSGRTVTRAPAGLRLYAVDARLASSPAHLEGKGMRERGEPRVLGELPFPMKRLTRSCLWHLNVSREPEASGARRSGARSL
jgi:hypothetical protein